MSTRPFFCYHDNGYSSSWRHSDVGCKSSKCILGLDDETGLIIKEIVDHYHIFELVNINCIILDFCALMKPAIVAASRNLMVLVAHGLLTTCISVVQRTNAAECQSSNVNHPMPLHVDVREHVKMTTSIRQSAFAESILCMSENSTIETHVVEDTAEELMRSTTSLG